MSRRRTLTGVQQAGKKIALTLEALANTGRQVMVPDGEGVVVDHTVEPRDATWRIRYRVRVRRIGLVWSAAESTVFG